VAKRRGSGEGSVRYNEDRKRWEARVTVDYDPQTGRQRRQIFTGRTRADVVKKLDAARQALATGRSTVVDRRTVGQYLDYWLSDVLPGTIANSTMVQYRDVARLYIVPKIGTKRIATLTPTDVSKMLQRLAADGRSPNTCRLARSVLRRALRRAEQDGVVTRNVAAIADGVKVPAPDGRPLSVEQANQFLTSIRGDRLEAAYVLALTLGLRRGELLGLSWDDIDLAADRPTLTVTRSLKRIPGAGLELSETKTRGSRRRVHLPDPAVRVLVSHRRRQAEERLTVGPAWPVSPFGADLVFRTPLGTPIDPDNFRNGMYRATEQAGIGRWSPHALRHSAASFLIAQGVPMKIVSEMLGHSSIRITADVYGHLFDDAGAVAADAMTALFG